MHELCDSGKTRKPSKNLAQNEVIELSVSIDAKYKFLIVAIKLAESTEWKIIINQLAIINELDVILKNSF